MPSGSASLTRAGSAVAFNPPPNPLCLQFYADHQPWSTSYEREVSKGEAVGDQKKKRACLNCDRLPKELLLKEAIDSGTSKARIGAPDAPARLDPYIKRLMREVQESEGRQKVRMDPEFVKDVKRRQKIDHVTTLMTEPRRPEDDMSSFMINQRDMFLNNVTAPGMPDGPPLDKRYYLKKNSYSEYVECRAKQAGLQGDKK
eukprot:TRINITY_DN123739_c0_g1_i1.p1 TRINITY_DN123739_c0_g1~~TRINITY_DN123739_c0_g1_i1.p1  ORF type:complete len:201 (+),score=60.31 TRINITY_DN123739_c0_g1_i1:93-695(+)